jgi:acyl transferase domain-containing protein
VRLLARGADREAVAAGLATFADGGTDQAVKVAEIAAGQPTVAFVFAGQSEIRPGMGATLYEEDAGYAAVVERCDRAIGEVLDTRLARAIYGSDDGTLLEDARLGQPALFALQCGLVDIWRRWGLEPSMVAGHSLGEYGAAAAAGAIDVDDGARLVAARGALAESLAEDGMMAVLFTGEGWVAERVEASDGAISIAAVNGPGVVVVAGDAEATEALLSRAVEEMKSVKVLKVPHAFHSRCVDPMLDGLEAAASAVPLKALGLPFGSTVEGRVLEPGRVLDPDYWRRHARGPVRFLDAMQALGRAGCSVFVEIGPHSTLTGLGERSTEEQAALWLTSLKRTGGDWEVLGGSATRLWLAGVEVDLGAVAKSCRWELVGADRAERKAAAS